MSRIECPCGSNILERGLSKHLRTKKHLKFIETENKSVEKCGICYENKRDWGDKCRVCSNSVCSTCFPRVRNKCPFCRAGPVVPPVEPQVERVVVLDEFLTEMSEFVRIRLQSRDPVIRILATHMRDNIERILNR